MVEDASLKQGYLINQWLVVTIFVGHFEPLIDALCVIATQRLKLVVFFHFWLLHSSQLGTSSATNR